MVRRNTLWTISLAVSLFSTRAASALDDRPNIIFILADDLDAFIRDNREVQPEGQLAIPADTTTIARLLQTHGYRTAAIGIRTNLNRSPGDLELYDLGNDPNEQKNLAAEQPGVVARIEKIMREQHVPSQLFPMKTID